MRKRIDDLWNGRVPLVRAFWDYAILWGTLLNLVATAGSLGAFALGWPGGLALAIHLFPLPYNILMVVAVWRSAARYAGPHRWAHAARAAIPIWAAFATLI